MSENVRALLADDIQSILVQHPQYVGVIRKIEFLIDRHREGQKVMPCKPILGHSGAGKTTVFEHFKAAYPPVKDGRVAVRPDGTTLVADHVPLLCVDLPDTISVAELAREMLRLLGDEEWHSGKPAMLPLRVDALLAACGTAGVLIDEGQRVVDRTGVLTAEGVVDWIKKRHAKNACFFLMFGMPRLRTLFGQDTQFYRRWDTALEIRPYRWDGNDRLNFMGLLNAYKAELGVPFADEVDVLAEDVAQRFHYASRGLVGGLFKLFEMAVRLLEEDRFLASVEEGHAARPYVIDMTLLCDAFEAAFETDLDPNQVGEVLVNPFGPAWNGQRPPPIPDENFQTAKAKAQRRRTRRPRSRKPTRKDMRRELDDALSKA